MERPSIIYQMYLPIELIELIISKLQQLVPFAKLHLNWYYLKKLIKKKCVVPVPCYNDLEVMVYLHETIEFNFHSFGMGVPCKNGQLEVVKYLHDIVGVGCTKAEMYLAIMYGHLNVVKYLHETGGVDCTNSTMEWASSFGKLEVMKYLHETIGLEYTDFTMNWAIMHGQSHVVDYLKSLQCLRCGSRNWIP